VLRLVAAADGQLARVRLPGGLVDAVGLRALATASRDLGDGRLELTSRGNVQLRGLRSEDADDLGGRLADAGLWPSQTHERVRNIVASPLSDLAGAVRSLDSALCADPRLVELSGRFLFGVDDGSGDIAALAPDVLAEGNDVEGAPAADVVAAMLAAAHAFLDERIAQQSEAWRVDDLVDGRVRMRDRLGTVTVAQTSRVVPPAPAGPVAGGYVLLVPLGRLSAEQADWLASRIGPGVAKVTPWRSVVLPVSDVDGAELAGFGVDTASRWYGVSACAGQPGCEKALADVQSEAARTAGTWRGVHFSGCGRRCGRPAGTAVDVIATENGYVIQQ
jgi:precorrin-3B synthase